MRARRPAAVPSSLVLRWVFVAFGAAGAAARGQESRADLRLHPLLRDGAVLLRDADVPITGVAGVPGVEVVVKASWGAAPVVAKADLRGRFRAEVRTPAAGGPYEVTVDAGPAGRRRVGDVLIGEVWLCSGQSNMEWRLNQGVIGADAAPKAPDLARVRVFEVANTTAAAPAEDVDGSWVAGAPETVPKFSAVAYFFARALREGLGDVPVGLVDATWGGTPAEAWTSAEALRPLGDFDADLARVASSAAAKAPPRPGQDVPSALFNGMVAPLLPAAVRGVIWYQGESNVGRAAQYRRLFPALIEDWRARLEAPRLPFLFVQIAPYAYRGDTGEAAELKVAQAEVARAVPGVGMVVTTDVGDPGDIHPRDKETVGRRLAALARAKAYGASGVVCDGPSLRSVARTRGGLRATFEAAAGLTTRDGGPPSHIEVRGDDGAWRPAVGRIVDETLEVSSAAVPRPVAVRFAWGAADRPNLINGAGLPAGPFLGTAP